MAGKQKKRSGGTKKYGRCLRKNSKIMYKARNQRARNKVKRVRQSNGDAAARSYLKDSRRYFPRVKRGDAVIHNQFAHAVEQYLLNVIDKDAS